MRDKLIALGKALEDTNGPCPEGWRQGQLAFNSAYVRLPLETNLLRGSPVDPFYNDQNISLFWESIIKLILKSDID